MSRNETDAVGITKSYAFDACVLLKHPVEHVLESVQAMSVLMTAVYCLTKVTMNLGCKHNVCFERCFCVLGIARVCLYAIPSKRSLSAFSK